MGQACRIALAGFLSAGVSRDVVVGVNRKCVHCVSPLARGVCRGDHIHHSGRRNMQEKSDELWLKWFSR
jgi:hypothetical protein